MRWVLVAALVPGMAMADGWQRLTGDQITAALTGRVVLHGGGQRQGFAADGGTVYDDSRGHWRVEGDQYCSQWPPSERWACYGVELNGPELNGPELNVPDIRFVAKDGSMTVGRFDDVE